MLDIDINKKKILKEKWFQYSSDLTSWVNTNIEVEQIVSISHSHKGGDSSYILWYWEMDDNNMITE